MKGAVCHNKFNKKSATTNEVPPFSIIAVQSNRVKNTKINTDELRTNFLNPVKNDETKTRCQRPLTMSDNQNKPSPSLMLVYYSTRHPNRSYPIESLEDVYPFVDI